MADDFRSSPVLDLTQALIARRSLTPDDAGCCALMAERLAAIGFSIEWIDSEGITNLWATYGSGAPLFVLAGHTDVVPPGPTAAWASAADGRPDSSAPPARAARPAPCPARP